MPNKTTLPRLIAKNQKKIIDIDKLGDSCQFPMSAEFIYLLDLVLPTSVVAFMVLIHLQTWLLHTVTLQISESTSRPNMRGGGFGYLQGHCNLLSWISFEFSPE